MLLFTFWVVLLKGLDIGLIVSDLEFYLDKVMKFHNLIFRHIRYQNF